MSFKVLILAPFILFGLFMLVQHFLWVAPDPTDDDEGDSEKSGPATSRRRKRDEVEAMADSHAAPPDAPRSTLLPSQSPLTSSQRQNNANSIPFETDELIDDGAASIKPNRRQRHTQVHPDDDISDCQIPLGFNLADTRRDFD